MIRVLVADDDGDLRKLLRLALELDGGFDVIGEADTGSAAIDLARGHQPDAVVLDLGLPDITARDLITEVRAAAPRARVVIFSGSDLGDQIAQEPVDGYVVKGGNLEVLLQEIHAATLPTVAASLALEADPAAARTARRFLHEYCSTWGCEGITDAAELVVSELVTNAVVHACTASLLRLRIGDGHLRVELLDRAGTAPEPQRPGDTEEHGRGLMLVAALSSAWGIDPHPAGKLVWAELAVA